jgi:hypothetical protein
MKSLRTLNTFCLIVDMARRADSMPTQFSNTQVAARLCLVVGEMRGSVVSKGFNEPFGRVAADKSWKVWIGEKLVRYM